MNFFKANTPQNIAEEYFELGKIDSSRLFAEKSLRISSEVGITGGIGNANLQLAKIALCEKKYTLAETYMSKCSNYFLQAEDPSEKRTYIDMMRQLTFAEGKYKEVYTYFQNYSAINDTILNSESTNNFLKEKRSINLKKDNQIKLQEALIRQESTLNYILIGSAVAIVLISLLTYRTYKQKQKLQSQRITELETEKQLMATVLI